MGFVERIREKFDDDEVTLVKSILVTGMKKGEFEQNDEDQTAFVIVRALKGFEVPIMVSKDLEIKEKPEFLVHILLRGIEKR